MNSCNNNSTTEINECENEESSQKNHLKDLPFNTNEINDTGKKWLNYTLANSHALRTVKIDEVKLATVLKTTANKSTEGNLIIDGGCDTTVCG